MNFLWYFVVRVSVDIIPRSIALIEGGQVLPCLFGVVEACNVGSVSVTLSLLRSRGYTNL